MRFSLTPNYQKVVLAAGVSILEANGTKGYIVAQKDHALSLAVAKKDFTTLTPDRSLPALGLLMDFLRVHPIWELTKGLDLLMDAGYQ